jgi:DNA-binding NarL/FixJ family response regulator/two-component sensor histidine kinase
MFNKTVTVEALNESILQLLEDERKRISMDLHDGVQNKLRLLRDKYLGMHPDFADDMKSILDEVRHVAYQLIPKNLQKYPLVDYLAIYAATLNQTYANQFKIDFQTNVEIAVPKKIEVELFKMVQEAFNNMLKYASNSPLFCIRYLQREDNLVLILQDFGDGFNLDAALEKETIGLNGIHTRAQRINAKVDIETGRFEGCKIKITLPIADWNFEENEPQNLPADYNNAHTRKKGLSNEIKHILIVDNQPEYGDFLKKLIQDTFTNVKVEYQKSAKGARNYLKEEQYQIDIVITDITMPDESGIRMIKNLRKIPEAKEIEFMIYSINDNPAYVFQACKVLENVKGYIWKEAQYEKNHPVIEALENWKMGEDKRHLSPNIKDLAQCYEAKVYDKEVDAKYRKFFQAYMNVLKQNFCESSTYLDGNKLSKTEIQKLVLKELKKSKIGKSVGKHDTIRTYYTNFISNIGYDADNENHHLLLRLIKDLDLEKEID